ncbi:hypothetical protein ACIPPS_30875 [Streptomyces sp. NPDC090127]|uniref:hypothetical protein n=1 Tax=Streptomyces sp. NPDC090127 TaxID=3365953 RepID=UPI00380B8E03
MEQEKNGEKEKLDLSVAQVSGSAIAAVVAAKFASTLGVYGTILGAGVISVIATCGGSIFHHLFKRTGEQIRVVTVHPEPSKVPAAGRAAPDRTQVVTTVGGPATPPFHEGFDEEFGEATTHGTRVRGWKRSAVGAALVFLVAMGGITSYELISDQDLSGTKGSTTFGSVVGHGGASGNERPSDDSPSQRERQDQQQQQQQQRQQEGDDGGTPTDNGTPGTGEATPEPTPTPSGSGGGDPTPTPTAPVTPTPTPTPTDPTPTPPPTSTPSPGAGAPDAGTPAE